MPKVVTLQSEKDFAHGRFKKSFSSPSFRIRVATNSSSIRFGFIISKKVMPKATDRNKIKRRIKSILSKYINNFKFADVLIFPQKISLKQTFANLESELTSDFKRLNLWK